MELAMNIDRTKPILLVLAHNGRSYIKKIDPVARVLGLQTLLVSSTSPEQDSHDHYGVLAPETLVYVPLDQEITYKSVEKIINHLWQLGCDIRGVISSYEGYRYAMAVGNAMIGAPDCSPYAIARAMDKLLVRQILADKNLTRCCAEPFSPADIGKKIGEKKYFAKPRRGAGSYGCMRVATEQDIRRVASIQSGMELDVEYAHIFSGNYEYMIETFVPGDEYSFEVTKIDGSAIILAIHAKYHDESNGIALEVANSYPAVALGRDEAHAGITYVASCLDALGLQEGAFHVEARYDRDTNAWDIIEINVRIGGALIDESVEIATSGYSHLRSWIESIVVRNYADRRKLLRELEVHSERYRRDKGESGSGTIFFSRYGPPGAVVKQIELKPGSRPPDIARLAVVAGTRFAPTERSHFLGNFLWLAKPENISRDLKILGKHLDRNLSVAYENLEERGD